MNRKLMFMLIALCLLASLGAAPTYAREHSNDTYIVQRGDTLIGIARRFGVGLSELARANGLRWNSWVYVGQRLVIPGRTLVRVQPPGDNIYIVQRGDTLIGIARRYGLQVSQLARANGLPWYSWVYVGQRLVIPGQGTVSAPTPPSGSRDGEKWIDVNLTTQSLTAYQGKAPVYTAVVSTGRPSTPTPVGEFQIWVKLRYDDMEGLGYYLPDVPYTMYFYQGYGLHGTYWHGNFGTPMSHGCVNLSTPDARWLYNWASVGTKVVTHY